MLRDGELPEFWRGLGLPGLIDVHVHFYPERMLRKVWSYFDSVFWTISYRGSDAERVKQLAELGVRAYPALSYAHRPGMAAELNAWALEFARDNPACIPSATFYPEPDNSIYIEKALSSGVRLFKAHLQVGAFDPRDELLEPVWGMLSESGTPVITHAGSGPLPGSHTGPGPIGEVLKRHPRLRLVIAHMGTPEYGEFLELAQRFERVHLDTTMAFTDFVEGFAPYPKEALKMVRELGLAGKILLGSDFPNIPYPYAHQIEALARLDLGDDWLRAVCWHNAARLLGIVS